MFITADPNPNLLTFSFQPIVLHRSKGRQINDELDSTASYTSAHLALHYITSVVSLGLPKLVVSYIAENHFEVFAEG